MKRYKWFWAVGGVAAILLCLYVFASEIPKPSVVANQREPEQKKWFFFFPVTFSSINLPCIDARIDGESFSMVLDLGFRGYVSLLSKHLEKISSKKQIGTKQKYNFKGIAHSFNCYSIAEISVGDVFWRNPILEELSENFLAQTRIRKEDSTTPIVYKDGSLGWWVFRRTNLFLDLGNAEAAVGFRLDTLMECGYPVDTWAHAPLLLDRGLVEFEATTSEGPIRCCLDTGSTWNILNGQIEGISVYDACVNPKHFIEYPILMVGETNIGPIVFRQIPVNLPIFIPITLGVDFFLQHQVFIDFREKRIYFSPAKHSEDAGLFS